MEKTAILRFLTHLTGILTKVKNGTYTEISSRRYWYYFFIIAIITPDAPLNMEKAAASAEQGR